jgi:hypothetical protein
MKVEGAGHYIFRVSIDDSGEEFVEESKYSPQLIPSLGIKNGSEHFVIFEAYEGNTFDITILVHSHDVHLLHKDSST